MRDAKVPPAVAQIRRPSLMRLLSCVRIDEVCVLQGAPVIGALFAMGGLSAGTLMAFTLLIIGNVCLVAHVFVLNDWAGIHGDLKDPNRAERTYVARGESTGRMGALALILLALSLLVFGMTGWSPLVIAAAIAVLSGIYSFPGIHGKAVPMLNSALHLAGGLFHFLLGYAVLAPISQHALAVGVYFGLVFAAGHLTHETRDHDGDRRAGIRTNAVAFGKRRTFLAGLLAFGAAYGLLTLLALFGLVPSIFSLAVVHYAVHLRAAWRAWRSGLTFSGIRRLQTTYRNIHLLIGMAMLVTVPSW